MKNPFDIMKQVENAYHFPNGVMCNGKKGKALSEARHVACYLVRKHTRYSFAEIGDFFGVDHSSVQYAVRRIRDTKCTIIRELVRQIENDVLSLK